MSQSAFALTLLLCVGITLTAIFARISWYLARGFSLEKVKVDFVKTQELAPSERVTTETPVETPVEDFSPEQVLSELPTDPYKRLGVLQEKIRLFEAEKNRYTREISASFSSEGLSIPLNLLMAEKQLQHKIIVLEKEERKIITKIASDYSQ